MKSFSVIKKCIISLLAILAIILVALGVTNLALPNSATVHTLADSPTAKAVYSTSGQDTTLTFYYDNVDHSGDGTVYGFSEITFEDCMSYDAVPYNDVKTSVTKVVFDKSFYDFKLTSTRCMFAYFTSLTEIENLTYLNTESVTDMQDMFKECNVLKTLDLSNFNTASVTNMKFMFISCYDLTTIYASDSFVTTNVTTSFGMFSGCHNLEGEKGTTYNSDYKDKTRARIDGGVGDEGYFTGPDPFAKAVLTENNTKLTFYFNGIPLSYYEKAYLLPTNATTDTDWGYSDYYDTIETVVIDKSMSSPKLELYSTAYMFYYFSSLNEIEGLENLNIGSVTNFYGMFEGCGNLSGSIVFADHFGGDDELNMSDMFAGCSSIDTVFLHNFNLSHVTNTEYMFDSCKSLTAIYVCEESYIEEYGFRNIDNSQNMFRGCENLVGGNGTCYDSEYVDGYYAEADGYEQKIGYLSMIVAILDILPSDISLQENSFEYILDSISPVIKGLENIDQNYYEISGDLSATVVGNYSITISLKDGVFFKDGTRENRVLSWNIFVYNPIGVYIDYANIAYQNTVYMFFAVRNNYLVGTPTVKLWTVGDGEYLDTDSDCVTLKLDAENYIINHTPYFIFTFDKLAMKQMTDDVYVSATLDEYDTGIVKYSILQYAYNQINSEHSLMSTKNTLTKMLEFGSALQNEFNYRLNRLADASYYNVSVANSMGDYDQNLHFTDGSTHALISEGETVYFASDYEFTDWYVTQSNDHTQSFKLPYGTTEYYFENITGDMFIGGNALNGRTVKIKVENPNFGYVVVNGEKYSEYTCRMFDRVIVKNDDGVLEFYYDDMENPLFSDVSFVGRSGGEFVSWDIPNMFSGSLAEISAKGSDPNSGEFIITAKIVTPTPKIVLSSDGKTATFYFDKLSHSSDTVFDLDYGFSTPFNNAKIDGVTQDFALFQTVEKVVFDTSFAVYGELTNMANFFALLSNLTEIDGLCNLNTSRVTNMYGMFYGCNKLEELDLSLLDMGSVTDYSLMFSGCTNLTVVDLSSAFNNKNGASVSFNKMFNGCSLLEILYVGKDFEVTDSVKNEMALDNSVQIINKGEVTPKAVYNYNDKTFTFYFDNLSYNDKFNDIIEFPFEKTEIAEEMIFYWTGRIGDVEKVIFDSSFAKLRGLTDLSYMFGGFTNLTEIEGLNYLNTSSVTNMTGMFSGCESLTTLDISTFNTKNVTKTNRMFYGCKSLTTIYVSSTIDFSGVSGEKGDDMFRGCVSLVGEKGTEATYWSESDINISWAKIDQGSSEKGLFTEKGVKAKAVLDDGTLTFYYNDKVYLGKTWFDVPTYAMSKEAWGYTQSQYSSGIKTVVFDESFKDYKDLKSTAFMFYRFDELTTITGLEYFYTRNVVTMNSMFYACRSLTTLDLSTFNTENVTDMTEMFYYCEALISLDLSSFDTANCTDFRSTFYNCQKLSTIVASNKFVVDESDVSYDMFVNCYALVGGKGTTFNEENTSGVYAIIDGGVDNPGYFTEKP